LLIVCRETGWRFIAPRGSADRGFWQVLDAGQKFGIELLAWEAHCLLRRLEKRHVIVRVIPMLYQSYEAGLGWGGSNWTRRLVGKMLLAHAAIIKPWQAGRSILKEAALPKYGAAIVYGTCR